MAEYVINYRNIHGKKDYLAIVAGEDKLIKWIEKNAHKCDTVHIRRVES